MIRDATLNDAERICEIYNYYVENTIVTFEEESVSPEQMRERISRVVPAYPWLVFEQDGRIEGYAYGSRWSLRSAYRYSVESTVYVDRRVVGRGIGRRLYEELLRRLSERGYHAVLGRLALPNEESAALHERLGFEKVGHVRESGNKFGKWIDVGYWELILPGSCP